MFDPCVGRVYRGVYTAQHGKNGNHAPNINALIVATHVQSGWVAALSVVHGGRWKKNALRQPARTAVEALP